MVEIRNDAALATLTSAASAVDQLLSRGALDQKLAQIESLTADMLLAASTYRSMRNSMQSFVKVAFGDDALIEGDRRSETDMRNLASILRTKRRNRRLPFAVEKALVRLYHAILDAADAIRDHRWAMLEQNAELEPTIGDTVTTLSIEELAERWKAL